MVWWGACLCAVSSTARTAQLWQENWGPPLLVDEGQAPTAFIASSPWVSMHTREHTFHRRVKVSGGGGGTEGRRPWGGRHCPTPFRLVSLTGLSAPKHTWSRLAAWPSGVVWLDAAFLHPSLRPVVGLMPDRQVVHAAL